MHVGPVEVFAAVRTGKLLVDGVRYLSAAVSGFEVTTTVGRKVYTFLGMPPLDNLSDEERRETRTRKSFRLAFPVTFYNRTEHPGVILSLRAEPIGRGEEGDDVNPTEDCHVLSAEHFVSGLEYLRWQFNTTTDGLREARELAKHVAGYQEGWDKIEARRVQQLIRDQELLNEMPAEEVLLQPKSFQRRTIGFMEEDTRVRPGPYIVHLDGLLSDLSEKEIVCARLAEFLLVLKQRARKPYVEDRPAVAKRWLFEDSEAD
jgi:hypothetical protein